MRLSRQTEGSRCCQCHRTIAVLGIEQVVDRELYFHFLFEPYCCTQIHRKDAGVVFHPVVVERHAVLVSEDELTGVVHQILALFLALVHHQIIHCQNLAFVSHVETYGEPLVVVVQSGFERVLVAVLEIFGVIGFVLHLQGIGIGFLLLDTAAVVQILRLHEGVADAIVEPHKLLAQIHSTHGADFHTIDTCVADVHELCSDTDTGIAQRFGFFNAIDHILRLVYHVIDRVDHRVVGVAEETELVLNHVAVLGVEGCYVERT